MFIVIVIIFPISSLLLFAPFCFLSVLSRCYKALRTVAADCSAGKVKSNKAICMFLGAAALNCLSLNSCMLSSWSSVQTSAVCLCSFFSALSSRGVFPARLFVDYDQWPSVTNPAPSHLGRSLSPADDGRRAASASSVLIINLQEYCLCYLVLFSS